MADVVLRNITKSFGKVDVLRNIDLEIKNHEFTVFVGPSGCGKSTLLRMIAGLEDIIDGEILIDGKVVNNTPPAKRGVAMVFQSYALYPHMTVYQNIAFGLRRSKHEKAEIHQRVLEAAQILQIEGLLDRKPKQLSGGQRQRVAIGRAIVRHPQVFLFDEPLSNLDATLRVEMRMQIARLKTKLQTTMIYVTHDQVEAMTLADKIVVLKGGCVEQVGSPLHLYHHPRNKFVAGFLGSPKMNFLDVKISGATAQTVTIELPAGKQLTLPMPIPQEMGDLKIGSTVVLGVRPESISHCTSESAVFEGKVRVVEHLGSETYIYLKIDKGATIMVRLSGDNGVKVNDRACCTVSPDNCYLFHAETGLSFERPALISSL
jgi:ABC-type sugar transport system ATPase subunit